MRVYKCSEAQAKYKHKEEQVSASFWTNPGGRLNKKDGLTRYGNSHVKDKTS